MGNTLNLNYCCGDKTQVTNDNKIVNFDDKVSTLSNNKNLL